MNWPKTYLIPSALWDPVEVRLVKQTTQLMFYKNTTFLCKHHRQTFTHPCPIMILRGWNIQQYYKQIPFYNKLVEMTASLFDLIWRNTSECLLQSWQGYCSTIHIYTHTHTIGCRRKARVFKSRYIGNRVGWGNSTKVSG